MAVMPWFNRVLAWLAHHIDMWRIAWREENRHKPPTPLQADELEFLPAILEIQESPPSPVGRTIGITIIILFTLAILWASFGKIDIVATAQGKVVASGRTKVIQPLEISVIKAIHVTEGQLVKRGDVLIELDPTASKADVDRLSNDLLNAKLDYAGNRAISEKLAHAEAPLQIADYVSEVPAQSVAVHQQIIENQYAAYTAKLLSLNNAIRKYESELKSFQLSVSQLEKSLPLIRKRAASFKAAMRKGVVAENQYLELQQQYLEKEQELIVTRERIHESRAAIAGARDERATTMAEFSQNIYTEMKKAQQQVIGLQNELAKARQLNSQRILSAPVDGRVQELAVFTVGGIVTPAQELMKIAPTGRTVEVEAWVENKDIGFVYPEQTAEIKLESFPFTRYGTIEGKVITLSDDAVPVEKRGMLYQARVSMNANVMQVENKQVNISPGMTATVEIKTGKRRVIEYFLSPVLKGFGESVRER
jgi:hemolysin D